MILSLLSMTLLLLRYNCIPPYQSSNFIQSLLNHPRSGTILFGIFACALSSTVTGTGISDISVSVHLYSSNASFLIRKDPSHSDNVSISSVFLELILVSLHTLYYMCFICCLVVTLPSFIHGIFHYTSLTR